MEDTSDIIGQRDALQIKNHLPGACQMDCWQLYYSRYRHGKSYKTLMRQSMDRGPVVILVLDERGETFGGFYTVGLNYGEGFVGTGESFLFKFDREKRFFMHWEASMKNEFYCQCNRSGFSMGAEDFPGIWISEDLIRGTSQHCRTYENKQ